MLTAPLLYVRRHLTAMAVLLSLVGYGEEPLRKWTNQQGRTVRAKVLSTTASAVVLGLENGTQSIVPISALSVVDQTYLQQRSGKMTASAATGSWPAQVVIDPKQVTITELEHNAAQREFIYESGSFRFIANAPLTGTVIKEVSADFEVTRELFRQLPWGWLPASPTGNHFKIYLTETEEDYIKLGGADQTSGSSKDDYAFVKFSAIGLKKVGPRYAYDARQKDEGRVVSLTSRLLLGEMRGYLYPWACIGLEGLVEALAYHNGAYKFSGMESRLKDYIAKARVKMDLDRVMTRLRQPFSEVRVDVQSIRRESNLDSLLLIYYFGFLRDDGNAAALHDYFRAAAKDGVTLRASRAGSGTRARPYDSAALEHLSALIGTQTDDQLRADIATRFRSINVKFK